MKQFFFGSTFTGNKAFNIAWLLFRFYIGFTIAIGAGWPKMNEIGAPGWFVKQVGELGFNFPSPEFWAAAAAWGEFVGGLCIAIGFFTRFSAIQLAIQFFVISFIWYKEPAPMVGMYYQQLLFWGFVLIAVSGSGKYAIDRLIINRKAISIMPVAKPVIATVLLMALVTFNSCNTSQNLASIEPKSGNLQLPAKGEFRIWDKTEHGSFSVTLANPSKNQSCELYTVNSSGKEKWVSPSLLANSELTITIPKNGHLFIKNFNDNLLPVTYKVNE
jgi:uncharacterized membrane protein YphA (DoxX/SURF4 family)